MAFLERAGRRIYLGTEQDLGRSDRCAIRLQDAGASNVHALLRWVGDERWLIKDLGSTNGTFVDDQAIASAGWHPLVKGATLSFGDRSERFTLADDSAPRSMIVPEGGGEPIAIENGVLALPSNDTPAATLLRGRDGRWRIELDAAVLELNDHTRFEVQGESYRFIAGDVRPVTTADLALAPELLDCHVHFLVTRDEESVELFLDAHGKRHALGSRVSHYLLLTLVRHKQEDLAAGLPEPASGWIYFDDLAASLKMTVNQLRVEIFRLREQLAKHGIQGAAHVVERRPRSGQLRTGLVHFSVDRV